MTPCIGRGLNPSTALGAHGIACAGGGAGGRADSCRNAPRRRSGDVRGPVRAPGGGVTRQYSGRGQRDRAAHRGGNRRGYGSLSVGQPRGALGRSMSGQSRVGGQTQEGAADPGQHIGAHDRGRSRVGGPPRQGDLAAGAVAAVREADAQPESVGGDCAPPVGPQLSPAEAAGRLCCTGQCPAGPSAGRAPAAPIRGTAHNLGRYGDD